MLVLWPACGKAGCVIFLRFISQAEIINAPNMELYQKKRSLRGPGHRAKGEILFSANVRALKEIKNHNHQERELTPPSTPKHLPRSIKKLSDTLARYEMNTFIQNILIIFYAKLGHFNFTCDFHKVDYFNSI